MKNLILTAVLSLGLTAASATAGPVEDCSLVSSAIFDIAKARDAGIGPEVTFNVLTDSGLEPDFAAALLELVYISGSYLSPKELKDAVFAGCIAELT
jgi:hypothetical protein